MRINPFLGLVYVVLIILRLGLEKVKETFDSLKRKR